jgi:hypothetical protein
MAGHMAFYLREEGLIDRAIVVCPAGLKRMWTNNMRSARVNTLFFTYYLLSMENKRTSELISLESELKKADEKTLIVLGTSKNQSIFYD